MPAVRLRGQRDQSLPGLRSRSTSSNTRASLGRIWSRCRSRTTTSPRSKRAFLKTMSKMGISTLRSYGGAALRGHWPESRSGPDLFHRHQLAHRRRRSGGNRPGDARTAPGGFPAASHRRDGPGFWRRLSLSGRQGERHLWNPTTISKLQQAAQNNDRNSYLAYAQAINDQSKSLCTLRGLFEFVPGQSVPSGGSRAGRARSSNASAPAR